MKKIQSSNPQLVNIKRSKISNEHDIIEDFRLFESPNPKKMRRKYFF